MIERLDVKHLLKSSNKQYWFGRLDNLGKYLDRIAAYFSGSVRRHRFAALVPLLRYPQQMNGLSLILTFSPPRHYGTCHMNNNFIYYTEKVYAWKQQEK